MTNKQHYERALPYLHGYKTVNLIANLTEKGRQYVGVEIFCPSSVMEDNVEHLKAILAGMGYSISGNKTSETITII